LFLNIFAKKLSESMFVTVVEYKGVVIEMQCIHVYELVFFTCYLVCYCGLQKNCVFSSTVCTIPQPSRPSKFFSAELDVFK